MQDNIEGNSHLGFQLPLCCLPFPSCTTSLPVACRESCPPQLSPACQAVFPGALILSKAAFAVPGTFNIHLGKSLLSYYDDEVMSHVLYFQDRKWLSIGRKMARPHLCQSVPWSDITWLQSGLQPSTSQRCNCQWHRSIEQTASAHHYRSSKIMDCCSIIS